MNNSNSSYRASNANIGIEAEVNRLKAQVLVSWEKEIRLLKWHGLEDGMKVLEVGCGPGFVTEKLVENLPNGELTAIDVDEKLLGVAKQRLEKLSNNKIEFLRASVYETGLPDNEYDFVVARLVFLHLFEPEKALIEIFRVLKPGGKIVIIDIDDGIFGLVQPNVEYLRSIIDKLIQIQRKSGSNREIGRGLPRLLQNTGFFNVDLDTISSHSDLVGLDSFIEQFNPKRFEHFYNRGTFSKNEYQSIVEVNENLLINPESYAMLILFLACGTKPLSEKKKKV